MSGFINPFQPARKPQLVCQHLTQLTMRDIEETAGAEAGVLICITIFASLDRETMGKQCAAINF